MTKKIDIKPLGDRVLVQPLDDNDRQGKTKSGIIIPDTVDREKSERGLVVAVGEGRRSDDGKIIPLAVKKGQTVIFSKYGRDEVKLGEEEYFIVSEANILAILN
ncbi:MAG: co-chaperone GroES [Patescibacteria group bacterium]